MECFFSSDKDKYILYSFILNFCFNILFRLLDKSIKSVEDSSIKPDKLLIVHKKNDQIN